MKTDRIKLEKLCDKMDLKCESANAHDFVATHRALAVLMVEDIGVKLTLKIFRKIHRESGGDGLPGLTGAVGRGPDVNCLKKRGISDDWAAWCFPGAGE